jgi:hypothetical protein
VLAWPVQVVVATCASALAHDRIAGRSPRASRSLGAPTPREWSVMLPLFLRMDSARRRILVPDRLTEGYQLRGAAGSLPRRMDRFAPAGTL